MSDLSTLRPTVAPMTVGLRAGTPRDAEACGQICYEAFTTIATAHGYPSNFPGIEIGSDLMTMLLAHPGFYSVVAEHEGTIVGSNFLDERSAIAGVGPITVDPTAQDRGIGRLLMQDVLDRAASRGFAGVRLMQAAYNTHSLGLYATMGFHVHDLVACMQGPPIDATIPGYHVRPATEADLGACNEVCLQVHGHDRGGELRDAIAQGSAVVVEHDARISGYATATSFLGHAVGETTEDIKAVVGAAQTFEGPGILVPLRNSSLVAWCLQNRLRIAFLMTLMSVGLYNEPAGAYVPSVLY